MLIALIKMKPYSLDLRQKIVGAYEVGETSIRKVARRFQVSKSTVQELLKRKKETGLLLPQTARFGKPKQLSGDKNEREQMVQKITDYTLAEYCEHWQEKTGIRVSENTMCRFLAQAQPTLKKNLRTTQALKEDNQTKRVKSGQEIRDVSLENLIFGDEMGVLLGMMR